MNVVAPGAGLNPKINNMTKYSTIPWVCPHCDANIEIMIEIDSPSDYINDNTCSACNKEINDPKLDDAVLQEASEYWSE